MLAKTLKGSRQKKVLQLGLDGSPVYGYYRSLSETDIVARIDWVIRRGYLAIEYDHRLPLLVYTPKGWEIERETYASELLDGFEHLLAAGPPYRMDYLKDRNRQLIWRLLELVEEAGDPKYVPLLQAWQKVDYRKVRERVGECLRRLQTSGATRA